MPPPSNPFAPLQEQDISPGASVFTNPSEDVYYELAKPEEFWCDIDAWTLPEGEGSYDRLKQEFHHFDSTPVSLTSCFGFDLSTPALRPADVLRTNAHEPGPSEGYSAHGPGGQVNFKQIIQQLQKQADDFKGADTVYLIVDSRAPAQVDYWPSFQPWWQSRTRLVGRHKETTRLCWYRIQDNSGVEWVPHIWAGVFVLLVARFLFPAIHIALTDTDCVPISLFEIQDLILLSQKQCQAHAIHVPPGFAAEGTGEPLGSSFPNNQPAVPGMLLFSEQFHDINAGLVISLSDPSADQVDLTADPERLLALLEAHREALLSTSAPRQTPTTMFRQGTLCTPFLGIECKTPLDLCWVWALQGLLLTRLFWPIPAGWSVGDPWPRLAHDQCLVPEARSRIPKHTEWARAAYEQGALSLLPELSAWRPAVVLPGPRLFQANQVDDRFMRPAIYHCFGRDKSRATGVLNKLALEGWESLPAVLLGLGMFLPHWQQTGWVPFSGMCWHGPATAATLSKQLNQLILSWWTEVSEGSSPAWLIYDYVVKVQVPSMHARKPQDIKAAEKSSSKPSAIPQRTTGGTLVPSDSVSLPLRQDVSSSEPREASAMSTEESLPPATAVVRMEYNDSNEAIVKIEIPDTASDTDFNADPIDAMLNDDSPETKAMEIDQDAKDSPMDVEQPSPDLPTKSEDQANDSGSSIRARIEALLADVVPATKHVYIDCPGLGGSQLGLEGAEHTLVIPKVGKRHLVYGPTLSPADAFLPTQVQTARGTTVGVHAFSQLMHDTALVEQEWSKVCSIDACTILHRSIEVARAAKRIPAHRMDPHAEFDAGVFWKLLALHPNPVRLLLFWLGMCDPPQVTPKQLVIRGFSAGSYVGAAIGLVASRLSASFRLQLNLGGIAMSESSFSQLCHLASIHFSGGPSHHIQLVHFISDKLCQWCPTDLAIWLMQHVRATLIRGQVPWMSGDQHNYVHLLATILPTGTWNADALAKTHVEFRPQKTRLRLPLRLASWMQRISSDLKLGFVLDLLDVDDHTFRSRVVTELDLVATSGKETLTDEQVKDMVLSKFHIKLGPNTHIPWLNTIARDLLRPLPLNELTVLIHAFLPQLTFEGETAIAKTPMVSRASLDGMHVHVTPVACGYEQLHEYWFEFTRAKDPIAFWIPGYDTTYTAEDWYEYNKTSIQLNIDEGTVLAFICRCARGLPVISTEEVPKSTVPSRPAYVDAEVEGSPAEPMEADQDADTAEATGPVHHQDPLLVPMEEQHFVFCGLVGNKDRPKKAASTANADAAWHRTQLKGLQVMLLPGVNRAIQHLLPVDWQIIPGVPQAMLNMEDATIYLTAMVIVGKTLGGSQLMNIAHLPAVHRPFVLGIPRDFPCVPFAPEHKSDLTDSLFRLTTLFVTQDITILPCHRFCQQILNEAKQDAGHLISTTAAIAACLESGRSSLALAGIFGAGKTTSMAFILMWIALTTPPTVKMTVVSKENPAGQAIASQVDRMDLDRAHKLLFCRAIGATEYDATEGKHHTIDAAARDPATHQKVATSKVLVVTTGTAFKSVDHWHPEIAAHFSNTCLFVHEESQQGAELLSVSAVAMTRVPCFVIYMGDSNQSPGGLKDTGLAKFLRGELLRLPIGLRAGQRSRTPATLGVALAKATAHITGLGISGLLSHTGMVSSLSVLVPWALSPTSSVVTPTQAPAYTTPARPSGEPLGSSQLTDPAADSSSRRGEPLGSSVQSPAHDSREFWEWVLQVAPECQRVHITSPVGTTLVLAHILLKPGAILTLQQTSSSLECCGLTPGVHAWGLTLSTTSRVPNPVYEALVGTLYPDLIQHNEGEWQFGTGTRNTERQEPHGFRFVFWRDATRRQRDRQLRGRATAKAVVGVVEAAYDIFEHVPCYPADKPGSTPGQIVITNTRFQRDSLTHRLPKVDFPSPVPNPAYVAPAIVGREPDSTRAPAPKRAKGGKGAGKLRQELQQQPELLTVVPTRVDTVVRLAGCTCYRAFVLQDAIGFLSGRLSRKHREAMQDSPLQTRLAEVKRREAYTRANVGLSRAVGTTIIISPLDMSGQPGACIVTAVLQTGLAVVDTDAYGWKHTTKAIDSRVIADDEMESRISGMEFGQFPQPMALCWQRHDATTNEMQLHRLHLVLVEANHHRPYKRSHPAYPGYYFIGVLWGYALDGEEKPVWEIHPDGEGWILQHVHSRGKQLITSKSEADSHRFWALHRVHAYDAFSLIPGYVAKEYLLESAPGDWQQKLRPSSSTLLQRLRDVRDDLHSGVTPGTKHQTEESDSDSSVSSTASSSRQSSTSGGHWVSGKRKASHGPTRTVRLTAIKEAEDDEDIGFPSSDDADESTWAKFNATAAELAEFCEGLHQGKADLPNFQLVQISQLPYEWPMARMSIDLPSVAVSFSQSVMRLAIEATLQGQVLTEDWLADTCERAAWVAAQQTASIIAPLFAGVSTLPAVRRFPAWSHLESLEFWQKAVYMELAVDCHHGIPLSRTTRTPAMDRRQSDTITSFILIQRQKQQAHKLPTHNMKVYFPCLFIHEVLGNLSQIGLDREQRLINDTEDAIDHDMVGMGTTKQDATQSFTTLVLKAGATTLPPLHDTYVNTPLTRALFVSGLFDLTAAYNIAAGSGLTKIRIEVKAATARQYRRKFDTELDWVDHRPTQWDIMDLEPEKVLSIASQSCGVHVAVSTLRERYRDAFVLKNLAKVCSECAHLFPSDGKRCTTRRLDRIYEEPGYITDNAQQYKIGENREWNTPAEWRERLLACGIDLARLHGQVNKPWETARPSTAPPDRERSRGTVYRAHQGGRGQYRSWR